MNNVAFVFGGKSTFTLESLKSGNRFTFKVSRSKDGQTFFVSVLNGTESDYAYIGCVFQGGNKLVAGRKGRPNAPSFKAFSWALSKGFEAESLGFHRSGRCCVCNRTLTTPESVANGIGPECSKKGFLS